MENRHDLDFAKLVDGILRAKGMKQKDLALKTGYDVKTISRICCNRNKPYKTTVISIGVTLGLNHEQIETLLILAGYSFSPTNPIDNYYIEVIKETGINDVDRITSCNDKLREIGVEEGFLLGSRTIK